MAAQMSSMAHWWAKQWSSVIGWPARSVPVVILKASVREDWQAGHGAQ
jgi:hypothetical protein